jgi:hypothetical protein
MRTGEEGVQRYMLSTEGAFSNFLPFRRRSHLLHDFICCFLVSGWALIYLSRLDPCLIRRLEPPLLRGLLPLVSNIFD